MYLLCARHQASHWIYVLVEFLEFYEVLFFPSKAQDSFSN